MLNLVEHLRYFYLQVALYQMIKLLKNLINQKLVFLTLKFSSLQKKSLNLNNFFDTFNLSNLIKI